MYQAGNGYGVNGASRDGASAGFGFHSQKAGDSIPSLRNGVEKYDRTVIKPTSNSVDGAFAGEVTFDFTSANNRWLVPSQCMLRVQLNVGQSAAAGGNAFAGTGLNTAARNGLGASPTTNVDSATVHDALPNKMKFTTCPVSALFRSMRLVASGVTVENLEHVHLASLLQLATETTPAMAATTLEAGAQSYGEIGYAPAFGADNNAAPAGQADLLTMPIDPKQLLCEAAFKNAANGQDSNNKGVELCIPLPLNFASQTEWWPACRWQLICEVDPNFHNNAVFSYGALTDAAPGTGTTTGLIRPTVVVRDISLDVATVKPIVPKAISSLQVHVPSQQIQAVPVTGDGQYTVAVPASTYACLVVFQGSDVLSNPFIDSTNFSGGQLVRNIRWTLGSTQWPQLDYDMKLTKGAGAAHTYFTANTANPASAAGSRARARRGRKLLGEQAATFNATLNGSRAYADYVDVCSKRYDSSGVMMTYAEWCQNPIFAARLLTPPGEISTNLRIGLSWHNTNLDPDTIMYVCPLYSKVVTAAYSASSEYPSIKVEHSV
jgi:hypothetical protein